MKRINYKSSAIIAVLLAVISCFAQANNLNSIKTVEQLYPNLAAGVLTYAKVSVLPEGVLLKSEGIEISSNDIDKSISGQPEQFQAELKKNAFFVLEQEATGKILKKVAAQKLSENGKDVNSMADNQLVRSFFEELTKDVKVTDKDIETFYKENESVFCGTPLEKVKDRIGPYVLQEKKKRLVTGHIRTLGQRVDITVSTAWVSQQAALAKDNPLDKVRSNGKPTLAVFSAASCCGADKMLPVLDSLKSQYGKTVNIMYLEARKEQILTSRYNVYSIPTQIFFDETGKEVFRHTGFFSKGQISKKLVEMGVK